MRPQKLTFLCVLAATATFLTLGAPTSSLALPDLVPEVFDLSVRVGDVLEGDVEEGCAGGRYSRRLVKFSLRTRNIGLDDLTLGDPGCPNCTLNPGATCTNPLFECGHSHGHAHFESFAKNQILDENDVVVAEGSKYGFCLLDLNCGNAQYSCSFQGISAGCSDVYSAGLPCQYVDITDSTLPDGVYKLRVVIDPDNVFPESDDSNNTIEVPFTLGASEQICPTYVSNDVPKAIPDNGVATSTLSIPDVGPVTSLRVRLNGTHPYLADLDVALSSPLDTTRTLFSGQCNNKNDFDLYLGDGALDPFVCPATDAAVLRTPEQSFAPFLGQASGGDWTLAIADTSSNDTGTLDGWSVEVCGICGNGLVDFGEACDDGNVQDGDCCSSDCQTPGIDGTPCSDGNACTLAETCNAGACIPGGDVSCDPCLVCEPAEGCVVPDVVYPCQEPPSGASLLRLRRDSANSENDSLVWRWRSQTPVELDEFGAPDQLTDLSLCIYSAGSLVLSSTIPAAADCDGSPCWGVGETSASFRDRSGGFGGMSRMRIKEGSRGKILTKGAGTNLELPELFLSLPTTVRLRRNDGTPCWEAKFEDTRKSTDNLFKARSR